MRKMIDTYQRHQFANEIASKATKALLYEVSVTPKPGLVDRNNQGSHKDMDFYSFIDSAMALTPFFKDMVLIGIQTAKDHPEKTFEQLQTEGMLAESAMLQTTGGVNTHKGAIFSLGIMCGALGRLWSPDKTIMSETIFQESKKMTAGKMEMFFRTMDDSMQTAGCRLYREYGIKGVRGEVAEGFPSVRDVGFPLLKELLGKEYSKDEAGSIVLLKILIETIDTNVISRSDYETLIDMKNEIKKFLILNQKPRKEMVEKLDTQFIQKNISPGGSADLLAACWFLYFVECV